MTHCRSCGAPYVDGYDHRACEVTLASPRRWEWDGTWTALAACGCEVTWRAVRAGTGNATDNIPDPCAVHDLGGDAA